MDRSAMVSRHGGISLDRQSCNADQFPSTMGTSGRSIRQSMCSSLELRSHASKPIERRPWAKLHGGGPNNGVGDADKGGDKSIELLTANRRNAADAGTQPHVATAHNQPKVVFSRTTPRNSWCERSLLTAMISRSRA
jgi:hypothetical protein